MCLFRLLRVTNHFWQNSHWKCFFFGVSSYVNIQVTSLWKTFLTKTHTEKGFSLVWVSVVFFWDHSVVKKHFWQILHWYGFSLVWVLMWSFRELRCEKHFWHNSQWNGFLFSVSPDVVVFGYCSLKNISDKMHIEKVSLWCEFCCVCWDQPVVGKHFWQTSQWKRFSLWCVYWGDYSEYCDVKKHFWQRSHW